jgi:predicted secreted protein
MASVSTVAQFLVLSEVDEGGKFEVQVNGLIVVALEENAGSTGYVWKYEHPEGTEEVLRLLAEGELYGKKRPPGAPGAHVFLLEAAHAGETPLWFGLYRSGTPQSERQVKFHIEIVPAN